MFKMELTDKIDQAKTDLEKARKNLLESYLGNIKEGYTNSSEESREDLLNNLEILIKKMNFDRGKARQIRLGNNLSVTDLGRELDISRQLIHQYEGGVIRPSTNLKATGGRKYLLWLKEQGYNPCNI